MVWKYSYDDLLERAYSQLPEIQKTAERFQVPRPEVVYEGKTTVIRNFREICETVNRDEKHILQFLLRELGTSGEISGDMAILQGRMDQNRVIDAIESYVLSYVICSECGSPDTELIKQERSLMLKCHACGALRPVGLAKIRLRGTLQSFAFILREGGEYVVNIEGTTSEGHGVTKFGDYTIIIPEAKPRERVRIRVFRIVKNIAYAEIVERLPQEKEKRKGRK